MLHPQDLTIALDQLDEDVEFQAHYSTTPYQFSFGYQNGGPYKVIDTASFAYKAADRGCERALVLLGEIDDVVKHEHERKLEFSVIGSFSPDQPDVKEAVTTAFREKNIRLLIPDEIEPLVKEVERDLRAS
jgi:hypothetical protein